MTAVVLVEAASRETAAAASKKVDKWRTISSLAALLVSVLANYAALAWVHERVPYGADPLPDVFFSLMDEYPSAIIVAECLLVASMCVALTVAGSHPYRWMTIRRACLVASGCYLLRAACVASTQVPVPSRRTYCDPVVARVDALLVLTRIRDTIYTCGMNLYFRRALCGDLVFSGHTVVFTLSHLITDRYSRNRLLSLATKATAVIGPFCILLARKHYTLDVVLAYAVCYLTFSFYHCAAEAVSDDGRRNAGYLCRFVGFMESDFDETRLTVDKRRSFLWLCNGNSAQLRHEITVA